MSVYKQYMTQIQTGASGSEASLLLNNRLHKSLSDSAVLLQLDDTNHKRTGSGNLPSGVSNIPSYINSNMNANSSSNIAIANSNNSNHNNSNNNNNNSPGNMSRSDSSHSIELLTIESCGEALYSQAIAAVFFKFSRSDAVVAETMANINNGVINVILLTLQAPELRANPANSSSNALVSLIGASPGSSMFIPSTSNNANNANGAGHRRTRSGPQPAYLEIVELLLKCLKNLSLEPSALDGLEKAGTMEVLVPLLNGPVSDRFKVYILPCIFNMCRINKRRQEQAATLGIVPHLKKVIQEGSHLRQFALPIMFDLAHASNVTRAELWKYDCVSFYVDLLRENYWQTFALNSLATW
jgi:hypothetical protein